MSLTTRQTAFNAAAGLHLAKEKEKENRMLCFSSGQNFLWQDPYLVIGRFCNQHIPSSATASFFCFFFACFLGLFVFFPPLPNVIFNFRMYCPYSVAKQTTAVRVSHIHWSLFINPPLFSASCSVRLKHLCCTCIFWLASSLCLLGASCSLTSNLEFHQERRRRLPENVTRLSRSPWHPKKSDPVSWSSCSVCLYFQPPLTHWARHLPFCWNSSWYVKRNFYFGHVVFPSSCCTPPRRRWERPPRAGGQSLPAVPPGTCA